MARMTASPGGVACGRSSGARRSARMPCRASCWASRRCPTGSPPACSPASIRSPGSTRTCSAWWGRPSSPAARSWPCRRPGRWRYRLGLRPGEPRAIPIGALYTLAIMTGIVMIIAGLLGGGRLVRFVPTAVMTGFLTAIGVNIILGQLSNFTGYASRGRQPADASCSTCSCTSRSGSSRPRGRRARGDRRSSACSAARRSARSVS